MIKAYNCCEAYVSIFLWSLIIISFTALPFAQTFSQSKEIDSLESLLTLAESETQRVDLLNELSYATYPVDMNQSIMYADTALVLSESMGYKKGKGFAYRNLGINHRSAGDIPKCLELSQKAIEIANDIDDKELLANAYNSLGACYDDMELYDIAIDHYKNANKYAQEINDKRLICFTSINLSVLYEKKGDTEKSRYYHKKGVEIAQSSKEKSLRYIPDLQLAWQYQHNEEHDKALDYLERSLETNPEIYTKGDIYNKIAQIYLEQGNLPLAEKNLRLSVETLQEYGENNFLEAARLELVKNLILQDKNDEAIRIFEGIKLKAGQTNTKLGKEYYTQKVLLNLRKTDQRLIENDFDKLTRITDSLYNISELYATKELEIKHQVERNENENTYLKELQRQNHLISAQRRRALFISLLAAALACVMAFFLYRSNRQKQEFNALLSDEIHQKTETLREANEQLKASNIELERFAYVASHDLKEPLRNIHNFSELLDRKLGQGGMDAELQEYLSLIKSNATQMFHLVEDSLEYSQVDQGYKEKYQETDLTSIINDIRKAMYSDLEKENAQIIIDNPSPRFSTITSQLFLVLKNLISNGIKYNTSETKIIRVDYSDQGEYHEFSVSDNGIGIEPKHQRRVFDMFKRLHTRHDYPGTGLGLAICEKIVKNLGGQITCESQGQGSTFRFTIAKRQEAN